MPVRLRGIRRETWLIGAAALLAAVAAYSSILQNDLIWDDYAVLRPRGWAELAAVWHGTWDPDHVWPVFYRPISVWYYAAIAAMFGTNALPLHVLSIIELTAAAWLLGMFVARESRSEGLGVFAAALLAVHPGIAHSAGPFVFFQTHLLATVVVCAALVVWQSIRHRRDVRAWWPIAALAVAGFLIKEDTVMILPLALVAQVVRARLHRDVALPSRAHLVASAFLLIGLAIWRYAALGEIGGSHDARTAEQIVRNVLRGPFRTLIEFRGYFFENGPVYVLASAASAAIVVAGSAWLLARRPLYACSIWATGVAAMVCFAFPLATMSNMWRYHLVTVGAVLVLAGAGRALFLSIGRSTGGGVAARLAAVAVLALHCAASRATIAPFSPCGYGTLAADIETLELPYPPEFRQWLLDKPEACRNGTLKPARSLPVRYRVVVD